MIKFVEYGANRVKVRADIVMQYLIENLTSSQLSIANLISNRSYSQGLTVAEYLAENTDRITTFGHTFDINFMRGQKVTDKADFLDNVIRYVCNFQYNYQETSPEWDGTSALEVFVYEPEVIMPEPEEAPQDEPQQEPEIIIIDIEARELPEHKEILALPAHSKQNAAIINIDCARICKELREKIYPQKRKHHSKREKI